MRKKDGRDVEITRGKENKKRDDPDVARCTTPNFEEPTSPAGFPHREVKRIVTNGESMISTQMSVWVVAPIVRALSIPLYNSHTDTHTWKLYPHPYRNEQSVNQEGFISHPFRLAPRVALTTHKTICFLLCSLLFFPYKACVVTKAEDRRNIEISENRSFECVYEGSGLRLNRASPPSHVSCIRMMIRYVQRDDKRARSSMLSTRGYGKANYFELTDRSIAGIQGYPCF